MVNLRNKYLLSFFQDKFLTYKFALICHAFYLTTMEFNLLRHHCKQNNIVCLNPKNNIIKQDLNKNDLTIFSNIFVSHNLIFFSNNYMNLMDLYKLVKLE